MILLHGQEGRRVIGDDKMIIPVRCFTCGKPLGAEYEEYRRRVSEGEEAKTVMDELNVTRYCCRRMLVSQVDLVDEIAKFEA